MRIIIKVHVRNGHVEVDMIEDHSAKDTIAEQHAGAHLYTLLDRFISEMVQKEHIYQHRWYRRFWRWCRKTK